jgi:hypothetical protein
MPNTPLPLRLRPRAVSRGVLRAYRGHAAKTRQRREHDEAITRDPHFALEHGLQVANSIAIGRGGCPFCGD